MKRFGTLLAGIVLMLLTTQLYATTVSGARALNIDGTVQGQNGAANGTNGASWETDEQQATSTVGVEFYLTWDDTNLYIAWVGGSKAQQHILWIDTDPQPTPTDGSGSTATFDYGNVTATLPFSGNFFVNIQDTYNEYRTNTSGTWSGGTSGTLTVASSGTTDDIEAVIPWNTITSGNGRPSSVYFLSYINDPAGGNNTGYVYGNAPSSNTNTGGGNQTFAHYFGQNVQSGVNPFGTVDASLAVELLSFSAKTIRGAVRLQWQTASERNNLGFMLERRESGDETFSLVADYRSHPSLAGAGNSSSLNEYSFTDRDVKSYRSYEYRLSDVDYSGVRTSYPLLSVETGNLEGGAVGEAIPSSFFLGQNSPNPFNPSTKISWGIPAGYQGKVRITIHDMRGRLVRTLYTGLAEAGTFTVSWNGQDKAGRPVSSGIYIVRLETAVYQAAKRMLLLK